MPILSAAPEQESSRKSVLKRGGLLSGSYSDIVLAMIIVSIVSLMILPLPLWVVDTLVAVNMLIGVGLVLLAIYIPAVTAFSSFPSVIMLSTLFRLALSVSITRLILLEADAGEIIKTFGHMVVGGNVVVGIVVFLIITVVQFIVIAKGSERVAEVAARFSLDAMPGKQLSIDSDLRSGLLDKNEAKQKRKMLELESQLHGSLDGAMKFVKGDSIAGIIILIVNILGGLTIGVLQRGMDVGAALHTYSVLTVGDGLVAQIPALLTSIAAGLIITRTSSESKSSNLGEAISGQISSYPKVIVIGGFLSLLLMVVPGFPWPIFLLMAIAMLGASAWGNDLFKLRTRFSASQLSVATLDDLAPTDAPPLASRSPVIFHVGKKVSSMVPLLEIQERLNRVVNSIREEYGVPLPSCAVQLDPRLGENEFFLEAHANRLLLGALRSDEGKDSRDKRLDREVRQAFLRRLGLFIGIQETADIINESNEDYPDLIKEMLRHCAPQRIAEVMRRLLNEGIPIRDLRGLYESIIDAASREKDIDLLVEGVRAAMRFQITDRFCDRDLNLKAVLIHPDLEDKIHQGLRNSPHGRFGVDPDVYKKLIDDLKALKDDHADDWGATALLCAGEIRRFLRRLIETDFPLLPVLSYHELAGDVKIDKIGHVSI
ncbi:Type III secretory pathway protein [gamma proteobacterium HdN1]|nr:Type III secretory pathway protein [gamma proteobacterium HdN1]